MKIFNIYPVKNQEQYASEDYAMILAHLLEKGLYDGTNFNKCRYIIMDNGAYEKSKVSNDILKLIQLANQSNIIIDELVIPDVIGDYNATKKLYYDNYPIMYNNKDDYNYMFVAHVTNMGQLRDAIDLVNNEQHLSLTLGIPKHCKINRTADRALELYKTCKVSIHFLGINDNYEELDAVKNIVRSCDSVQLSYLTRDYSVQDANLLSRKRKEPVINLETDEFNTTKIKLMKAAIEKELKTHGFLR